MGGGGAFCSSMARSAMEPSCLLLIWVICWVRFWSGKTPLVTTSIFELSIWSTLAMTRYWNIFLGIYRVSPCLNESSYLSTTYRSFYPAILTPKLLHTCPRCQKVDCVDGNKHLYEFRRVMKIVKLCNFKTIMNNPVNILHLHCQSRTEKGILCLFLKPIAPELWHTYGCEWPSLGVICQNLFNLYFSESNLITLSSVGYTRWEFCKFLGVEKRSFLSWFYSERRGAATWTSLNGSFISRNDDPMSSLDNTLGPYFAKGVSPRETRSYVNDGPCSKVQRWRKQEAASEIELHLVLHHGIHDSNNLDEGWKLTVNFLFEEKSLLLMKHLLQTEVLENWAYHIDQAWRNKLVTLFKSQFSFNFRKPV